MAHHLTDSFFVHLDYEASSFIDLKKLGGYRYACDDSTKILMFAIAQGDGTPLVWDFTDPKSAESIKAWSLFNEAVKKKALVYAWNAPFEHAMSRYQLGEQVGIEAPEIDNYRCVAAMARRAAMPNALGKCAEELQVDQKKAKVGQLLINCFSDRNKLVTLEPPAGMKDFTLSKRGRKPKNRKSNSPIHGWQKDGKHYDEILWDWLVKIDGEQMAVRTAWEMFKEYCRQDVVVEQEIHRTLKRFELTGPILESFQFNMRMNDRGIPVNVHALENASKIINQFLAHGATRFQNMTGGIKYRSPKLLSWMQERGYIYDNMQAKNVEKALKEGTEFLTRRAFKVLKLKSLLSFSALSKVPSMLGAACPDGKVRGTMLWHVARTGRIGGRIIQPQNMKKASEDICSNLCYWMIDEGCSLGDLEELWESPMDGIASSIRHFIHDKSSKLYDADYTGVEARITPWLAGNERKLSSVLAGEDQYLQAASLASGISYESLFADYRLKKGKAFEKANKWRTIGKPIELSCCFGTGAKGMQTSLRETYGVKLSLKECKVIVSKYRDENPETVEAWNAIEEAFRKAINGETSVVLDGKLKIGRITTAGMHYVVIKLPSGRNLFYPRPHTKEIFKKFDEEDLLEEPWKKSPENWSEKHKAYGYWADTIRFWGSKDGKPFNWVATWGSRLFENCVQSIGVDLLDRGCIEAEKAGHEIFMVVHDQAIAYENELGLDHFIEAFTTKDKWAESFPLAAEGNIVNYYLKN